jgi:hypothetical protein
MTTIPRRFIDRCRNVDLAAVVMPSFLSVLGELCASSRYRNRPAIQSRISDECMIASPGPAIALLIKGASRRHGVRWNDSRRKL